MGNWHRPGCRVPRIVPVPGELDAAGLVRVVDTCAVCGATFGAVVVDVVEVSGDG